MKMLDSKQEMRSAEEMREMKRINIAAVLTAVFLIGLSAFLVRMVYGPGGVGTVSVGFIYENDESTPYTYNFALAELRRQAEQERFGDPNNSAEAWARKMALDMAQNEVTKARESGQDEAEAFNRAVKRIQQKAAEMATEPQA